MLSINLVTLRGVSKHAKFDTEQQYLLMFDEYFTALEPTHTNNPNPSIERILGLVYQYYTLGLFAETTMVNLTELNLFNREDYTGYYIEVDGNDLYDEALGKLINEVKFKYAFPSSTGE